MTDDIPGADQAAAQAMIGWLDTAIEMEGDPDQKLGLQRCRKMIRAYLALQQENAELQRALTQLQTLAKEAKPHRDFYSGNTFSDVSASEVLAIIDPILTRKETP